MGAPSVPFVVFVRTGSFTARRPAFPGDGELRALLFKAAPYCFCPSSVERKLTIFTGDLFYPWNESPLLSCQLL